MVKKIIYSDKNYFQCEECGFQYAEKEWADKCEAWCKEHHSCNIEITAHAIRDKNDEEPKSVEPEKKLAHKTRVSVIKSIFKQPFYLFIAVDGALALGLLYWWLLSKTTTLVTFYGMYWNIPIYFWPYVFFTLLSMILFGISLAVAIYSWQRSKLNSMKNQGSNVFGAAFGAFAAACPICGSFLLSAIGITGGVAILPFKGLELKLLSAGFFGAALFMSTKKLSEAAACDTCKVEPQETAVCQTCGIKPQETAETTKKTGMLLSYQTLIAIFFLIVLFAVSLWRQEQLAASTAAKNGTVLMNKIVDLQNNASVNSATNQTNNIQNVQAGNALYDEVIEKVIPKQGFQTKIVFGDAIVKLVQNGVIDIGKFNDIYKSRGVSDKELAILVTPSYEPIKIDANNAGIIINLLWPLGLSNKTQFNEKSPVNGESLFNFASTGGWTLGKEDNGGKYFNKFGIVKLTPEQEAIALDVAKSTYRPCCGNSSFFQDCNHGSALLGLIELGASQGLSRDELYKVALQFNSFWFPQTYIQTALYYELAKNIDWENVDAKEIMGFDYSSGPGWAKNVVKPFQEIAAKNPGLMPQNQGGRGCGI